MREGLASSKTKDSPERARSAAEATIPVIRTLMSETFSEDGRGAALVILEKWTEDLTDIIKTCVEEMRAVVASPDKVPPAEAYLGKGSARMYRYVRNELHIPVHRGLEDHPTYLNNDVDGGAAAEGGRRTMGSHISELYAALRSGEMHKALVECFE